MSIQISVLQLYLIRRSQPAGNVSATNFELKMTGSHRKNKRKSPSRTVPSWQQPARIQRNLDEARWERNHIVDAFRQHPELLNMPCAQAQRDECLACTAIFSGLSNGPRITSIIEGVTSWTEGPERKPVYNDSGSVASSQERKHFDTTILRR